MIALLESIVGAAHKDRQKRMKNYGNIIALLLYVTRLALINWTLLYVIDCQTVRYLPLVTHALAFDLNVQQTSHISTLVLSRRYYLN